MVQKDKSAAASVILAEFAGLRNEIDRRSTSQHALLSVVLTASTAVFGTILVHRGLIHLLLALPFITAAMGTWFVDHHWTICDIGRYIGSEQRGQVRDLALTGSPDLDARLFSWEARVEWKRSTPDLLWWRGSLIGAFVGPGLAAAVAWGLVVSTGGLSTPLTFGWRVPAYAALLAGLWLNVSVLQRWRTDPASRNLQRAPGRIALTAVAGAAVLAAGAGALSADVRRWEWAHGRPLVIGAGLVVAAAAVTRVRPRRGDLETFERLFAATIRVQLDWAALARTRAKVTVLLPSRREIEQWYSPWYVTRTSEPATFDTPGARPLTFAEVVARPELVPPERRERIDQVADRVRRDATPVTVATCPVGGRQLVLDGNHRIAAALIHGLDVPIIALSVQLPMDPSVLPDLAYWA